MKRITKKILSIVLVVCFTIWTLDITYATETNYQEYIYNSDLYMLMSDLVHKFYSDVDLKIKNVIPIYGDNKDICEYAIDLLDDEMDIGYVIIECGTMNIIEFKIERNIGGFYEMYFDGELSDDKIIRKVDIFKYELVDIEEMDFNYLATKDDLFDLFLYEIPEPVYHNYYLKKEKYIPRHCSFGEEYIENILGSDYCCVVVAMLNVCGGYNFFNKKDVGSINWAYGTLWSMAQVKQVGDGYVANQECMGGVVSQFAKWYAGKDIPYTTKNNPKLSFFIDAIDKKYSSILGITSYYYETDEKGNKNKRMAGHAVSVEGYLKFEPIVYGTTKYYLYVSTGWGTINDTKYVLYDNLDVISTYGVTFQYAFK